MINFRALCFSPVFLCTALFGLSMLFLLTGWDYSIQLAIAAHDTQPWNSFWRVVSLFGLGKIQASICVVALYFYVGRQMGILRFTPLVVLNILKTYLTLWAGRARISTPVQNWPIAARALFLSVPIMFAVGTLCALLKIIIGRPRPKMMLWHDETAFLWFDGLMGRYQSMPSGHVMTTFALLTILWPYFPKLRWPLLVYGVLSAVARVMSMTTHYVSDVLLGAALGIAFALLFNRQFVRGTS